MTTSTRWFYLIRKINKKLDAVKKKHVYSVVLVWLSPNDISERPIISQLFEDFQIKKK